MNVENLREGDSDFRTFAATVAYDGSNYGGWQRQINSTSVQQVLEEALTKAVRKHSKTVASGRTDAGVHAIGQVVRFRTTCWSHEPHRLIPAINRWLPPDIAVQDVREVVPTFHPIRQSIAKTYRYTLRVAKSPDPFDARTSWYIPRPLDIEKMKEAAAHLVGEHDFISFQSLGSPRTSTIRTIHRFDISTADARFGQYVYLDIEANGFLYNMARCIAGTLVILSGNDVPTSHVADVLHSKSRRRAGQNAPPWGLCLQHVQYPSELFMSPPHTELPQFAFTRALLDNLEPKVSDERFE